MEERERGGPAHLLLDADCERELRESLTRETQCCSFFDFILDAENPSERLGLTVRVPAGSETALAFLLELTPVALQGDDGLVLRVVLNQRDLIEL